MPSLAETCPQIEDSQRGLELVLPPSQTTSRIVDVDQHLVIWWRALDGAACDFAPHSSAMGGVSSLVGSDAESSNSWPYHVTDIDVALEEMA